MSIKRSKRCVRNVSRPTVGNIFYNGRDTGASSSSAWRLASVRWSNSLIQSPVYNVLDVDRLVDSDSVRLGNTKESEWSVGSSETVWQRGRKAVGVTSTSFDGDCSSWSAPGCWLSSSSTTICGTVIAGSCNSDAVVTWSDDWPARTCREEGGWLRGRRHGTLPDRLRCPDVGRRRDVVVCWSYLRGDGGS